MFHRRLECYRTCAVYKKKRGRGGEFKNVPAGGIITDAATDTDRDTDADGVTDTDTDIQIHIQI